MGTGGTSPSLSPVNFRVGLDFFPFRSASFLPALCFASVLSANPSACRYLLPFARFASLLLCFLSSASLLFRSPCSVPRSSALLPFPSSPLPSLSGSLLPFRSVLLCFPALPFAFAQVFRLFPACTLRRTLTTAHIRDSTLTFTIDLFVSFLFSARLRFRNLLPSSVCLFKRLNEAFDLLVSTTCTCYHASSVDLSTW